MTSNLNWLTTTDFRSASVLPTSGSAFGTRSCAATAGSTGAGFVGAPMRERHVDAYIPAKTGRRTWSPPIT